MTPLGHAATGYLVGRSTERLSTTALILGAVVPDVDFALFFLDDFNSLHRTVTHSLLFVVVFAALAALFARRARRTTVLASAALGGLLHLLADSVLDGNPSNGIGVAWSWPASDQPMSPFNLLWFTASDAPSSGWADLSGMLPSAGWAVVGEIVLCLALALALRAVAGSRRPLR